MKAQDRTLQYVTETQSWLGRSFCGAQPSRGPRSRLLGKGYANETPDREEAGSERHPGLQSAPWWFAPPLLVATGRVEALATVFSPWWPTSEITDEVHRNAGLVQRGPPGYCGRNLPESVPRGARCIPTSVCQHHPGLTKYAASSPLRNGASNSDYAQDVLFGNSSSSLIARKRRGGIGPRTHGHEAECE